MLILFHLCAVFLLVGLGFYVFAADPRRRAHQAFAAFISFLALWTIKDLIFWDFYPIDAAAGAWAAASFIIALLMNFVLVAFAWVFPENSRTPRRKAAILFAPALIFIPSAAFGLLWENAGFTDGSFSIKLTPLAYAFVTYVYFLFFYGSVLLFNKYRKYRGTESGSQLGAVLLALGITGALKTLANIVFPLFGNYDLIPLSSIFVLPGVLIYAYAIFNFRLFSLTSALTQFRLFPVAYKVAICIAAVAVSSFLIFQIPIVWWAFHNGMDAEAWRRYLVFSVISALVPNLLLVLLVLRTVSRPIRRITLAAVSVAKGTYGTEVDLRKTNDEIGLLADSFNRMSRKMAEDLEELSLLNERMLRTEKLTAMGTLAAGVAREVSEPLEVISARIERMRREEGHSTATREDLNLIAAQVALVSQIISDMRNFGRVGPRSSAKVSINDVVLSAVRLARIEDDEVELAVDLDPIGPLVIGDDGQLVQLVLNLLLHTQKGIDRKTGVISVATASKDDNVEIEIVQSGSLFPDRDAVKPERANLDLWISHKLASLHHGTLTAITELEDRKKFVISLPLLKQKDAAHVLTPSTF
ncbi:MAG: multi-sensor signal transduction histidine kinase [Acidobacteria bacterium OLB17]|nr:MAG: multi-sensor signal transduction histidine kinase [Acidobacteria bacterium OLB17]MCZ2389463.1 HAMP domain-containing protein [Acidobacteriota bacterium]